MSSIESENVEFEGAHGHPLAGRIYWPPGRKPTGFALFAHCFTCSKDLLGAVRIASTLAEKGWAVLSFDFTGLGESAGDFAETNFSSNLDDLTGAADFLRQNYEAPRLLFGHSLGGAAVIAAAERIPESTAVATIGAPCDPYHVAHLVEKQAPGLKGDEEATVQLGGRPFLIKGQLLEDLAEQTQMKRLAKLGRALLVIHSPVDEIVGIEEAKHIYDAARHPKSFVALDGADHLIRRRKDSEWVGGILAAWASRY